MKYNSLGKSKINVSEICLGSMTWGTQNNFRDAKLQIDIATGYGVNFIDTADVYGAGKSESRIGEFLKKNNHMFLI